MNINLNQITGDLGLEFPLPYPIEVLLQNIHEGSGTIAIAPGETHLNHISIKKTFISVKPIKIDDGHVDLKSPVEAHTTNIDMSVGSKTRGKAKINSLRLPKLCIKHSKHSIALDLECRGVSMQIQDNTLLTLQIETADANNITFNSDGLMGVATSVHFEKIEISISKSSIEIDCDSISSDHIDIKMPSRKFNLKSIRLDKGFSFKKKQLKLSSISIAKYEAFLDRIFNASSTSPLTDNKASIHNTTFIPSYLDTISGTIHTDLNVKATVPVIGKRNATHRFRVPIDLGVINFKSLEESLSNLENAFIDFNLRGQSLVLERDIPLIPGFEKPIVSWNIKDNDMSLAKQNRVKLSTLLTPTLVESSASNDGKAKSKIKLHQLDFENIAINLQSHLSRLLATGAGGLSCSFGKANSKGRLFYDHDKESQLTATSLDIELSDLNLIAESFEPIHGIFLDGHIHLASNHKIQSTLHGLIPKTANVQGHSVTGLNIVIGF